MQASETSCRCEEFDILPITTTMSTALQEVHKNGNSELPCVSWTDVISVDEWLKTQPWQTFKEKFNNDGYLIIENILYAKEVAVYRDLVEKMLAGEIDTSSHRHDLGNHADRKRSDKENICQIMWPTLFVEHLNEGPLHARTLAVAKIIIGNDADFDFDMLLSKAPHTSTETPWHQDESYWPALDDKRSVSFWTAMDDVFRDSGCMWFSAGSHKNGLRAHRPQKEGCHVLTCEGSEAEGSPAEIKAGSCTLHHGRTLHYTRGNTTDNQRRAFVTAYRPADMIKSMRERGFDHGKKGLAKSGLLQSGQTHTGDTV
ncbi:probable alpha-ketoglutarate-dependent hypophosphite dioxygenase [Haliotis asinina]|uniref:probable alpha-ketoglutarate-dependent hypophosphite dioxygenase n=1 Tax=Haliotis asinina TaxID=109174 RepID=UPI0035325203